MTKPERPVLGRKLLAYLRKSAEARSNSVRTGPFVATFSADSDNPYLNYAIPDDDAEPDTTQIAGLVAPFEARKRKPRLEYMPDAAPKLQHALTTHGFAIEARVPVMLCPSANASTLPAPPGIEVFSASADADLEGAAQAQAEAYEDSTQGSGELKRTLSRGGWSWWRGMRRLE